MILFRRPETGVIVCIGCLTERDRVLATELDPALFPGTYERLTCTECGAGEALLEGAAVPPIDRLAP